MLSLTLFAAAISIQTAPAQSPKQASLNPNATELFERDPELRAWALRAYDSNRDGWLTLYEAQPALASIKEIADADRDGRVTVREYEAAREFIRARWAPQQ